MAIISEESDLFNPFIPIIFHTNSFNWGEGTKSNFVIIVWSGKTIWIGITLKFNISKINWEKNGIILSSLKDSESHVIQDNSNWESDRFFEISKIRSNNFHISFFNNTGFISLRSFRDLHHFNFQWQFFFFFFFFLTWRFISWFTWFVVTGSGNDSLSLTENSIRISSHNTFSLKSLSTSSASKWTCRPIL